MIAFLINELDIRGGTHKQFLKLLDYTSKKNVDFFILTKRINYQHTYPGFQKYRDRIYMLPECNSSNRWMRPMDWIRYAFKLRKILKDVKVVNIHDNGFEMFFAMLPDKKIYWQINDLPPCFQTGVFASRISWKNAIKRFIVRFGVRHAVQEISVNVSKNKKRVQSCLHRDAKVFYCGIEPLTIQRSTDETFHRFNNNTIHLLSSGVFFPYRNYETLIYVVKQLIDKNINPKLDIIGATSDTNYEKKIREMIRITGLQHCINICGSVDEQEFDRLHQQADLFLFLNIDQSWGLAVFEAMSCGLPVLVSNSVGATEILHDHENALFLNPTDTKAVVTTIIQLMHDHTFYKSISDHARKFPDLYTWDHSYSSKMLALLLQSA